MFFDIREFYLQINIKYRADCIDVKHLRTKTRDDLFVNTSAMGKHHRWESIAQGKSSRHAFYEKATPMQNQSEKSSMGKHHPWVEGKFVASNIYLILFTSTGKYHLLEITSNESTSQTGQHTFRFV